MSTLHERFQAIKDALHNALNLADPEAAVREAEEAFKASIVAEVTALNQRIDELSAKLNPAPIPVVVAPQPASVEVDTSHAVDPVAAMPEAGSTTTPGDAVSATTTA